MPVSVVFGASGAIGRFLLPRLLEADQEVVAVSREPRASGHPRLRWIAGNLPSDVAVVPGDATIFSLGPLDAFAAWFAAHGTRDARVIAIGSRSIETKKDSQDAGEREVALRLARAEAALDASGARVTVLRPTLIYGAGLDRSLTPLVAFARRWRVFAYVAGAKGLRQPVHADDLAAACFALARTLPQRRVYDVGGGERLAFSAMLRRVRASLPFSAIALPVPLGVASAGAGLARVSPAFRAASAGALARMQQDLIADHSAAAADFGWSPRAFRPQARDWTPPPLP
ncbi:MAG TPA: NAD-dependent epimerase/dehydratase family protein [Rhodanobacteraceae bacterium]